MRSFCHKSVWSTLLPSQQEGEKKFLSVLCDFSPAGGTSGEFIYKQLRAHSQRFNKNRWPRMPLVYVCRPVWYTFSLTIYTVKFDGAKGPGKNSTSCLSYGPSAALHPPTHIPICAGGVPYGQTTIRRNRVVLFLTVTLKWRPLQRNVARQTEKEKKNRLL